MLTLAFKDRTTAVPDRQALFESLVREAYRPAYGLAYRLTGNASEAEDLMQETFVRAFRFFHRYDDALPFSSWLYRIMTNAHIDLVRRRGKLRTTSLDHGANEGSSGWEVPDPDSAPDREMMRNAVDDTVQAGLLAMTAEFRTAVLLADVEGLAYEEVADIMRTSVGTVRSRIHRGRKQLRAYLLKHAPDTYSEMAHEL